MADEPIRILVVDDSALYRQLVRNVLREIPGVEVVGAARSGEEALQLIDELTPDLMTLDVRMPGVDGMEVLRELKRKRCRTRAIMLSSLTANGAQTTTDSLLEGAFDFILKPSGPDANANRQVLHESLSEKIHAYRVGQAGRPRRPALPAGIAKAIESLPRGDDDTDSAVLSFVRYEAVAIGTSTGGPVALREVLPLFPGDFNLPILIVQHMPAQYTHSLAERLNEASQIEVVEAVDGMVLEGGWAYLAPGGRQMKVVARGAQQVIRITDDPPENSCRPAVDYLFRSVAEVFEGKAVGVILTGMGRDGVEGCRELKKRGGFIVAQSPDSCVVYGMPKAVVEERLADRVIPLDRIAVRVLQRVRRSRGPSPGTGPS